MFLPNIFQLFVDPCSNVDILFILESSTDVRDDDADAWNKVLELVYNIVLITSDFANVHAGLVIYSDDALIQFGFGSLLSQSELHERIKRTPFLGGRNNMEKGLRLAREEILGQAGDRPGVPNIVIIVSSGPFSGMTLFVENEAKLIKENPSNRILIVGITESVNYGLLRKIVSQKHDLYMAKDHQIIETVLHPTIQSICQTYVLPPITEGMY